MEEDPWRSLFPAQPSKPIPTDPSELPGFDQRIEWAIYGELGKMSQDELRSLADARITLADNASAKERRLAYARQWLARRLLKDYWEVKYPAYPPTCLPTHIDADNSVLEEEYPAPIGTPADNRMMICYGTTDARFCFAEKDGGLMAKLHQAFLNYLCKFSD